MLFSNPNGFVLRTKPTLVIVAKILGHICNVSATSRHLVIASAMHEALLGLGAVVDRLAVESVGRHAHASARFERGVVVDNLGLQGYVARRGKREIGNVVACSATRDMI